MDGFLNSPRGRARKRRPVVLAALILVAAAVPAWADGASLPNPASGPVSSPPLHGDVIAPEHRVKLNVPQTFIGDQSALAPKLSIELGYGGTTPLNAAPMARLPDGLGGRTDLRAIKADISLGF